MPQGLCFGMRVLIRLEDCTAAMEVELWVHLCILRGLQKSRERFILFSSLFDFMVATTSQISDTPTFEHVSDGVVQWNNLWKKAGFGFSNGRKLEPAQKAALKSTIKETLVDLAPDDKRYFLDRAAQYQQIYADKNREKVLPGLPTYEAAQQQFQSLYTRLDTLDTRAERGRNVAVGGLAVVVTLAGTIAGGEAAAYFSDIRAVQHVGAGIGAILGGVGSAYLGANLSDRLLDRHVAGREIHRHEIDEQVEALFLQDVAAYVGRK